MAAGDALDQVLSELNTQQQAQQQRRVPAPAPSVRVAANGPSQAAAQGGNPRPQGALGGSTPSFMDNVRSAAGRALDTIIPGLGTVVAPIVSAAARDPSVGRGIVAGVARSPVTAAAGIADFAGDVGKAVAGPKGDFRNYQANLSSTGVSFRYTPQDAESISNFSRRINPLSGVGNQTANETAAQMAGLAVAYGAGSTLSKFAGVTDAASSALNAISNPIARTAATVAARAGGFGLVDAVAMDPEAERFSNILQRVGVHNEFTDWLAHDDAEGHMAGRFKNAVEGLGLGAAGDTLVESSQYWRARLRGDHAGADAIQQELARQHDGEVPDYTVEPMHPEEPLQEPAGYVGGWEQAPDGSVRPVYAEDPTKGATPDEVAKAADDGVEPPKDTATPNDGLPKGPGEVKPIDPLIMARAMGDKDAENAIQSFRVKQTPEDPGTVVGPISSDAIKGLANEIEGWRGVKADQGDRALDITKGTEAAAAHGEFRLGNIASQEAVAPTLRAVLDHIPETTPRTDEELMGDVAKASAEMGEDPAALLESARLISGKLGDADTAMGLIRTVWKKAGDQLDNLPTTNWETASQEDIQKASEAIYNMMAISSHVQQAKAGLGRGLRVNQLPDAESYLSTVERAANGGPPLGDVPVGPLPRTPAEVQTWMDAWQATKNDPKLRADLLEGALTRSVPGPGQYLRNAFPNFFTAAILSAPRTHMLGFTGPVLMSILRNVERMSGGFMASLNPFLSAADRQANLIAAKQSSFAYVQTLQNATDVLHWAAKAGAENASQLHGGSMIQDATRAMGPLNPALVEAAGHNPGDVRYALGNALNIMPRAIGRLYNFTDEFTQRLAYYGEVRARATVEGATQGLGGDDLKEFVHSKLKASVNDDPAAAGYGSATDQAALASAQSNSFLNPVGVEGSWQQKITSNINSARQAVPELRYLLPVFNVPANILGQIMQRTPLAYVPGLGLGRTAAALRGEMGPIAQAEAHGRMLTGAAFLTAGTMLARAGLLTGAGPQEPTARKVWLMEHEPWSLRVGDNWVRVDKYDTAGGLLTIPATVADATQYTRQDEKVGDLMMAGVGALAEWFKDRASMRTAATLFELGDDPTTNTGNALKRLTAQTAAGFIPNALQTLGTQQVDTTLRRKQAWTDYLKGALPGLSPALPPVRNVLGEPVTRAADTFGEALFPVTIAPAVTFKQDPVIDEIDRLYHVTGYAAGADPKMLGYGFFHPQDVTLENGQSLYDAFMQSRQHLTINGLTLKQALGKVITSPEYNAAVDADPGQKVTSRGDASRGYMVEQTFAAYNRRIKAELAEASPTANKWLTAAAAKQRDDAYLRDTNVEDLVNNPALYQTHHIDPSIYSGKLRAGATGVLLDALGRKR